MPFFLSHIESLRHVATKLKLRQKTTAYDLALIGCILPDLEIAGVLPCVHGKCKEFYEYLLSVDPSLVPLAVGMLCHELYDNILEPGYVSKKEQHAENILKQYYPDLKVKLAAHIFVEHAMDVCILEEQPLLLNDLKRALKKIDSTMINRIVNHLCFFFHADHKQLSKSLFVIQGFDVSKLKKSGGLSKFWLNCMFLLSEKHILHEHSLSLVQKIKSALRISVCYSKHAFLHSKEHAKLALHVMRESLNDQASVRKKSKKILAKKIMLFVKRVNSY